MLTNNAELTENEFGLLQALFENRLGIYLPDHKKTLVGTRLWKRLRACHIQNYADYYHYINKQENELELCKALELITTNETYFFREPKHFDFLQESILPDLEKNAMVRLWSAACSSGEEIYSLAMIMSDKRKGKWEILGSDINQSMLDKATKAIYKDQRTDQMPEAYRKRFCRRGVGPFEGCLRINPDLRSRAAFRRIELHNKLPDIGVFDVVFIRNVMIYFDNDMRRKVVDQVVEKIKPGGYLFVGLSESLRGLNSKIDQVMPAVYRVRSP